MKYRISFFLLMMEMVFIVNLNAQSKKEYMHYLVNNSIDIQVPEPDWNLVFDSSFYRNEIFWVGETHAIKYSYDAKWILFRELHKKTGFRYYLLEAGFITEIILNKYLETGDEKYLKMDFDTKAGTLGWNKDAYEFYHTLYQFNQSLPKDNRIEFVSIDIEHQYAETDKYIRSLFQNREIPKDTLDPLGKFLQTRGDYQNSYKKLWIDLSSDSAKYKTVLGSDYSAFWYMVRNINYLFLARGSANWGLTRDSLMFENYKTRCRTHDFQKSKVFAYFGNFHCYMEKTKHAQPIASLIKSATPAMKSTSIMMIYADCKAMTPIWLLPKTRQWSKYKSTDFVDIAVNEDPKEILSKSCGTGYTLFNIVEKSSPFISSKLFIKDIENGKHTSDYFQYILLIKDSPASIPYNK